MEACLKMSKRLREWFPGLRARVIQVDGVEVERRHHTLEVFKEETYRRIRERWTLEGLREHPVFRAYRDFFWAMRIDPTKTRPAAEALIRRVLHRSGIPLINSLVDAYNLASMETAIPLAAFDKLRLEGELLMRMAEPGESFLGIGMKKPRTLRGGEAVVEDGSKLVAIYPYRNAEDSKVTLSTTEVLLMVCGAPDIPWGKLTESGRLAVDYITRFCNGRPKI